MALPLAFSVITLGALILEGVNFVLGSLNAPDPAGPSSAWRGPFLFTLIGGLALIAVLLSALLLMRSRRR